MKNILKKTADNQKLSFEEIQFVIRGVVQGSITEAQLGAFFVLVTQKGIDADEVYAFAASMREFSHRIILNKYIVDSCGTGADLSGSINISTAAAIVANAAGVNVLKQTNSSITSACGSSDFLKAMNIDIARISYDAKNQFAKNNIAFVHSPYFNDFAAKNNPIRQQIGIKTIFNYLGPLINPAFPNAQLLGVSSLEMCEKMAGALQKLGTDRALVVNGLNPNLDEISLCSKTFVCELKEGKINSYELSPEDFGFKPSEIEELQGGDSQVNSQLIKKIFACKIQDAKKNVIALNAGAMIYLAGLKPSIYEGVLTALEVIDQGLAYDNLLKIQGISIKC